jgi:UDP-2-acetamido-3-amino-2,3-dideoxy-glucuronate N-acetyltransferase
MCSSTIINVAIVGSGRKVCHSSHVLVGLRIVENCYVGQNLFIEANVTLSDARKIQNNVSVYK